MVEKILVVAIDYLNYPGLTKVLKQEKITNQQSYKGCILYTPAPLIFFDFFEMQNNKFVFNHKPVTGKPKTA
jgi:hypothetical protein